MYCLLPSTVPPVVEVSEPPFNSPLQERVANQQIAFPCPAKGEHAPESSEITIHTLRSLDADMSLELGNLTQITIFNILICVYLV